MSRKPLSLATLLLFAPLTLASAGAVAAPAAASPVKVVTPSLTQAASYTGTSSDSDWLGRVNQVRAWTGQSMTTVQLDTGVADTTRVSMVKHLQYMVTNNILTHAEDSSKPGYTPQGDKSGRGSDVLMDTGVHTPVEDINMWATGPFHLMPMIRPAFAGTAYGNSATFAANGNFSALDVWNSTLNQDVGANGNLKANSGFNGVWPTGNNVDLYSYAGYESPDPVASCDPTNTHVGDWGLPIVASYFPTSNPWPPFPTVTSASVNLLENGIKIPACVVKASDNADLASYYPYAVFVIPNKPLLQGAQYTGSVTTNLGTKNISFTTAGGTPTPTPTPTPTTPPTTKTRGDLNGDGKRDELMLGTAGVLWMLPGKADGSFGTRQQVPGDYTQVNWFGSPGDMNKDGYQDIMMRLNNGDLMLYFGNGSGGFKSSQRIGTGWGQMDPQKLFPLASFMNGKPAILAVNMTDCKMYRYGFDMTNMGINQVNVIGTGWCGMSNVFSNGDNSGDGISDIVGITKGGDYLVYYGTSAGGFGAGPFRTGWGWQIFSKVTAPGDATGDGNDDVLALQPDGTLYQYPTLPGNNWGARTNPMSNWYSTYKVME